MSRTFFSLVAICFLSSLCLGQVDTLWFRHHQFSPSYSEQYMKSGQSLVVDADGNSYVCAYGQFRTNSQDFIVLKYDKDGSLVWASNWDGGGAEVANAIAVDEAGAVYVTGQTSVSSTNAAMFTAKWNADGRQAWSSRISGAGVSQYNAGQAICCRGGAVYVAGQLTSVHTGPDMALVKLDAATGGVKWRQTYSRSAASSAYEAAGGLAVSQSGAVFVGGRTFASGYGYDATFLKYDANGVRQWERNLSAGSGVNEEFARICLAGELVVGTGFIQRGTSQDAFTAACLQSSGAPVWKEEFAGPGGGTDQGADIAASPDGDIFVCGLASGNADQDALVLKYRSDGALLWSRLHDSGLGADEATGLAVDKWGDVAVSCRVSPRSGSEAPLEALKFSADGEDNWSFRLDLKTGISGSAALDVGCFGGDVIVAGITCWPYPNGPDPSVFRLTEVPDVGVQSLLVPPSPPNPGEEVIPRAVVKNFSLMPASFSCRLEISDGYAAEVPVSIAPGSSVILDFPGWTPQSHGHWLWRAFTTLGLDFDHSNDSAEQLVYVNGPRIDAGVTRLLKPDGNMYYQTSVVPSGTWYNFGTEAVDAWVYMVISQGSTQLYRDSVFLSAMAVTGRDTTLTFKPWIAAQCGLLTARCSTWVEGDGWAENDKKSFSFGVINEPVGRWAQMPDVPSAPSANPVAKGGGLALSKDVLYVMKSNKTREVHVFDLLADGWRSVELVPEGSRWLPVGKGGAIVADDLGRLYVVKGNKTREFYRFDPVAGWASLESIPLGPKGKLPKGGTGLAYAVLNDTGYVFFLKGANTAEFYRYNIVRDTWESLPYAPAGNSGKDKYTDGSSLASDRAGNVYCLKGKYNEVFRFDALAGKWADGQLADVPFYGADQAKRKVGGGGDICWADGRLAVLKGGNTRQFWRLEPADSNWYEYPQVEQVITKPRRVKDGGGVEYGDGHYYVLKGNKTFELWRFDFADVATQGGRGEQSAVQPRRAGITGLQLAAVPNPIADGLAMLRLSLPGGGPVGITVFNATGRAVLRQAHSTGRSVRKMVLDCRTLPDGVYLIELKQGSNTASSKVVVSHN